MNRRHHLKTLAALAGASSAASAAGQPVVLLVDLEIDPPKEQELLTSYRTIFRPAIRKQPGFVDVRLMKLLKEAAGKAPPGCSYRLLISFQTEEQRVQWVATTEHQKAWPAIEKTLTGQKYIALVYQPVS